MNVRAPFHIFIVEDNKLFVKLLDYVFSKSIRYRFLDFKSGEDCLENLSLNPGIVVLDANLPWMSGYETLLELREQNADVHIIMVLDRDDTRLPGDYLKRGADDYVIRDGKEEEAIVEKIEATLKRKDLMQKAQQLQARPRLRRRLYYALLAALLASLGYIIY